jgi:penicillin-binding protein 1A
MFGGFLIVLPLFTFMLYILVSWGVFGEIPDKIELKGITNHVASEVYAADGVLLGKYYIENRTNVDRENMAPVVLDALVATEDVRFYQHNGIDFPSLGRVFIKSILLMDRSAGGGSTITQQLAKNLYPRKNYWLLSMPVNKIRETIIAKRLEGVYSKQEIITMYLNTVPFGGNVFGIEAAARRFFNKSSANLQAEEAAVLVGMLKATTSYNPRLYPDRSEARRNVVLSQMEKYGFITEEKADSLQQISLTLDYHYLSHNEGLAPYFRERLRGELDQWLKTHPKEDGTYYNLYTDGLKIHTSIDSRLQQYAEIAVAAQMKTLQQTFLQHWDGKRPWGENAEMLTRAIRQSKRYQGLLQTGKSEEEIEEIFNTPVPMTVYSWDGVVEKNMSPKDSIMYYKYFINDGFLDIETKTG